MLPGPGSGTTPQGPAPRGPCPCGDEALPGLWPPDPRGKARGGDLLFAPVLRSGQEPPAPGASDRRSEPRGPRLPRLRWALTGNAWTAGSVLLARVLEHRRQPTQARRPSGQSAGSAHLPRLRAAVRPVAAQAGDEVLLGAMQGGARGSAMARGCRSPTRAVRVVSALSAVSSCAPRCRCKPATAQPSAGAPPSPGRGEERRSPTHPRCGPASSAASSSRRRRMRAAASTAQRGAAGVGSLVAGAACRLPIRQGCVCSAADPSTLRSGSARSTARGDVPGTPTTAALASRGHPRRCDAPRPYAA